MVSKPPFPGAGSANTAPPCRRKRRKGSNGNGIRPTAARRGRVHEMSEPVWGEAIGGGVIFHAANRVKTAGRKKSQIRPASGKSPRIPAGPAGRAAPKAVLSAPSPPSKQRERGRGMTSTSLIEDTCSAVSRICSGSRETSDTGGKASEVSRLPLRQILSEKTGFTGGAGKNNQPPRHSPLARRKRRHTSAGDGAPTEAVGGNAVPGRCNSFAQAHWSYGGSWKISR